MIAVVPINDIEEHETFSTSCRCEPHLEFTQGLDMILVHDAFDGRHELERLGVIDNNGWQVLIQ